MANLSQIYLNIDVFLLILVRMAGFVMVSPIFGRKGVPNTTKIGFSFFLSYIVFFNYDVMIDLSSIGSAEYILIIFKETMIGVAIGFIAMLFFSIFYTAGQIADFQMGFNLGGMYDQQMQTKVPIIGNLFYVFAFLTFLNLHGMEKLSRLIIDLYKDVPILGNSLSETIYGVILNGFYTAYLFSIRIVLPLMLLMLITQFLLGVIIKFVPQMNVFIIGIPIKIVLSLMLLVGIVTPMYNLFEEILKKMINLSDIVGHGF